MDRVCKNCSDGVCQNIHIIIMYGVAWKNIRCNWRPFGIRYVFFNESGADPGSLGGTCPPRPLKKICLTNRPCAPSTSAPPPYQCVCAPPL